MSELPIVFTVSQNMFGRKEKVQFTPGIMDGKGGSELTEQFILRRSWPSKWLVI